MKRLLDYDHLSGVKTWHEYDDLTKETIISQEQDVGPILERNKKLQNIGADGGGLNQYARQGIKNDFVHVGTIPVGVQLKWRKEHGVDIYNPNHTKAIMKLMNDPDYRYLRTATGRY